MDFLGVKLDIISWDGACQKARDFLRVSGQYKIFTPNPEMLVKAQKDEQFKAVLNSGDLNICDGFGLALFSGIKRIPGSDFAKELCRIVAQENKSVFLLGGMPGAAEIAAQKLPREIPGLKVGGFDEGPVIHENITSLEYSQEENNALINKINDSAAEVLLVAFGMGKQEKWIEENLKKMPKLKIAIGVGGTLEFWSEKIKRAPLFLRKIGLEWVYRLVKQPSRWKRIYNATVVFVYYILVNKLKK